MSCEKDKITHPEQLSTYFKREKGSLVFVACSGILYNIGMIAGPWFEGQLAQYLCDIIRGRRAFGDMVFLAGMYLIAILSVQMMRYLKRLYVRKFANHINRDMKRVLYRNLVHRSKQEFETESVGSLMTKAILDVDVCVEGMRKFTTEVFDTGVVMAAYLTMLFIYDWRMTLLSALFPPVAYVIAEKLKKAVSRCAAAYKESAGKLNGATLDRVSNAITYRVYGQETNQRLLYEQRLTEYEQKAVLANLLETSLQPLYQIISMTGVIFILWFGAKNVLGSGWASWNIAAFTTFLSCFTKLAAKSSKAAKLFNAVQKAKVSWHRITPFLAEVPEDMQDGTMDAKELVVSGLSFAYPKSDGAGEGRTILKDITFTAKPGQVIGVTGPVACGKSTFGKVFLCEYPYQGSIRYGGEELSAQIADGKRVTGYMGHEPELLSETIRENILLGERGDASEYLKAVCMENEVDCMPDREETVIGSGGVRLSGGQQARIALARTLFHKRPILVLDDPFSAVDLKTEAAIMDHLKEIASNSIVFILSHRLTFFPAMDQVIWIDDKRAVVSSHEELLKHNRGYACLYRAQSPQSGEKQTAGDCKAEGGSKDEG